MFRLLRYQKLGVVFVGVGRHLEVLRLLLYLTYTCALQNTKTCWRQDSAATNLVSSNAVYYPSTYLYTNICKVISTLPEFALPRAYEIITTQISHEEWIQ